MSDHVTQRTEGAVSVVTVDDGKANALSADVIATISGHIAEAEGNDDISAVVLAGRPGVLSGGFDLGVMRGRDAAAVTSLVADGGALVRQSYGASVPVVGVATGHAVAAGALVLLGCDVRFGAAGDFKIGLPEVAIGMSLPTWSITIGNERLSKRHVLRATSLGRMVDPATAVDVGFLDEVVEGDAVAAAVDHANELASTIDLRAYAAIVEATRGATLAAMDAQITADRAAIA